ncbi:hypothetical protein [Legionella bononiensis]|uniref:DrrA phosphatidylinositol 4-phosphate binding domain-containing protein n=1 Tax=Legionella bononiensis TaxID=2793102 RepID=A0ABS1WEC2_9GAMM|nr:hypothetical protein [Legionella bononiensis]MBL7479429.1 hypothetical protein [Legionella bononiensis]MBL7527698.1 hypothetical protein [Legionella bononiensis]MBL7563619.1 hypothetical protein [Legionella bononiensis]
MARKKLVIQDKAVIARMSGKNPVGEARKATDPIPTAPMTDNERKDMAERLELSLYELMDDAENTYQANCHFPETTDVDPDYITRLSTNEFFFYTKEPLTLEEFEALQNKIATKAKTLSPGVQLILGSFAVKTEDDKVMNVTPHITCGKSPNVQLIVKNYTSSIDVRYKIPDGKGDINTLPVLDKSKPSSPMPRIMINGMAKEFTFNNIVHSKTPGGSPFVTAIDICLDHARGVAKSNYAALVKKKPELLRQPISHVVVSNSIAIDAKQCIGSNVMHVDPYDSPVECKKNSSQQSGLARKLPFGKDEYKIFEVARAYLEQVINTYAYKTTEPSNGRDHKSYTVSLDKIKFQKSDTSIEFQNFKNKYQAYKGDQLKTQILEDLKSRIQDASTKQELKDLKEELKTSYEGDVLKTGQGWFTQTFGLKTSSMKALEHMIEQQEEFLSLTEVKPSG